ncbi:MAG: transcriptional repressor [Methanobacteriaceae archaeon]|jgi:Fe2+ or Zn2+ uptake regulation protein|nr:MAG: ferric uptake regulation protein [Methanobacterium sp. BRmetb2]MCC7557364.1 transcriptional repressor [Methanobacteriaceae archaeon]
MEEKFREKSIKITPQRQELIKKLKELENTHPSFNNIYKAMKNTQPNISRSTVHKNLKLLEKIGFIQSFHYNGETRYEMNPEPHINLADPSGNIIDIKNKEVQKYLKEIERVLKEDQGIEIKRVLVIVE